MTQVAGSRGMAPSPGSHSDGVVIAEGPAPALAPEVGRVLGGRYRLKAQIGVGGFGVVFAADDMRLQKRVAVKILSPRVAESEEAVERFRREALAASAVRHESIVDVTDFDIDDDGTRFIVMEYLDGVDLADVLDHERVIPPARALFIATQTASALAAAHDAGILHRDLKPANIYLTTTKSRRDFVKIIDFGISKVTQLSRGDVSLTSSQLVMGTPHYMSHEQARGLELDGRSDVYALGVILYEMLVGIPPFQGRTPIEILTNAAMTQPTPPSQARPDLHLPPGLDGLVLRALARDREARYATMEAFGEAITMWLHELDPVMASAVTSGRQMQMYTPVPTPPPDSRVPSTLEHSSGEIERAFAGATPTPRRRSRLLWMVPLFLVFAAGSAVVVKFALKDDSSISAAGANEGVEGDEQPDDDPTEKPKSDDPGEADEGTPAVMPDPGPPMHDVEIKLPAGVSGTLTDGKNQFPVPGTVQFEAGSETTFTLEVEGHEDTEIVLSDAVLPEGGGPATLEVTKLIPDNPTRTKKASRKSKKSKKARKPPKKVEKPDPPKKTKKTKIFEEIDF